MPQSENLNIAIVVGPISGNNISKIAEKYYLWVVKSPVNLIAIKELKQEATSFPFKDGASPNEMIDCYIDTVIEHHPNWKEILLVGAHKSKEIENILLPCSPFTLESTEYGLKVKQRRKEY